MNKGDIEKRTEALLDDYGYSSREDSYLDIVSFVQSYGFIVGNADLGESEDGFISVRPDLAKKGLDKVIGVNSKRPIEYKRFIIAHEFAHYILHCPEKSGAIYLHRENMKGKNGMENEADYFAACLLMPKESFKREYKKALEAVRSKNQDEESDNANYTNQVSLVLSRIFRTPSDSVVRRIDEVI